MFNLLKHVFGEYKSLIVKMHMDAPKNKFVTKNRDLFYDLELVFALPCIFPMLEMVHTLIKYIQK
jgi:type III secretory pathway component EscT